MNSVFTGAPNAIYADDCASSVTVINNRFFNVSGGVGALEGGKGHVFVGNHVGPNTRGLHAVAKGCTGALQYLALVPFNTSQVWLDTYPELALEVAQDPNAPWHLSFVNNTFCNNGTSFVDMGASTVLKYNGTDSGNVPGCS